MNDDDDKYLDPKQNPMIRIEDENGYSVPVDLVASTIRDLTKDGNDVEGPGFEIISRPGLDPVVQHNDKQYELDKIPPELGSTIIKAVKKHKQTVDSIKRAKYLDPETNPMIRFDED